MYCPNCGKDAGESKYCPECGSEVTVRESPSETQNSKDTPKKKGKKGCGIAIAIIAVIIAIVIGVLFVVPMFSNSTGKNENDNKTKYLEISDTELGLLTYVNSDIAIISFKYDIKNISEKTIESMTEHFSIYNEDGVEKGSTKYTKELILKPGESTDPEKFDYWKYFSSTIAPGYDLEFEDVIIDGVFTVDYKSVKITSIELKFSDETTDTQIMDYAIDRIYLKGTDNKVNYYIKRNEDNLITEQCSIVFDDNNKKAPEGYNDKPYYYPVND